MRRIESICSAMNHSGIKATIWEKGNKKRVYIKGHGRDMNCFLEFDLESAEEDVTDAEPDELFSGCALKVFTNAEQTMKWRINRSKDVKHELMHQMHRAGIVSTKPCDNASDVIL